MACAQSQLGSNWGPIAERFRLGTATSFALHESVLHTHSVGVGIGNDLIPTEETREMRLPFHHHPNALGEFK